MTAAATETDASSLSSTPSHSEPSPFDSPCFSRAAVDDLEDMQKQMGYMGFNGLGVSGRGSINNMMDSNNSSPSSNQDGRLTTGSSDGDYEAFTGNMNMDSACSSDERQAYRHGQMGAFKHFPRFNHSSTPIISDNWRASSRTGDQTRLQLGSLITSNTNDSIHNTSPVSPVTPGSVGRAYQTHAQTHGHLRHPSSPFFIDSRSFVQPNPPSTPASMSMPMPMPFPGLGARSYSPAASAGNTKPPATTTASNDLASQFSSVNRNPTPTNATVTVTVTLSPDTLGYCFVRADGSRTRLVPVDMLPVPLQGIPTREESNERLVALPVPGGVEWDGRSSNRGERLTVPVSISSRGWVGLDGGVLTMRL